MTSVSGEHGHLGVGEDEPARDGRRHDGHAGRAGCRVEHRRTVPLIGQGPGEARRARTGGRTQHDGIAVADKPRDPSGQAGRVPRHRVEAAHRQRRHGGSLGDRGEHDDAGRAVAQQALEGDVEPREGVLVPRLGTPGGRQCLGQRSLLIEQLHAPVPDPPRLDEHHLGSPPEQIGHDPLALVEEREPRLHSVELITPLQPLPHRGPPGPACDQRLGRRAQLRRHDELSTPVEDRRLEVVR